MPKQDSENGAKISATTTDEAGKAANAPKAAAPPGAATSAITPAGNSTAEPTGAIALLKADHRKVEALFAEYEMAEEKRKAQIIKQVCLELTIHTMLEEEIFYPACRDAGVEHKDLDEAQVEHDSAKMLISDLRRARSVDPYRDAKVIVLSEQVKHHVAEEEKPGEGIFAKAEKAKLDTNELAQRLTERKQELQSQSDRLSPSQLVSIQAQSMSGDRNPQEDNMPRQGADRDERGRFTSDDDDRDYGRGGGRGNGGSRSYAAQNRDRDERGRFTDDDDDRGGRGGGYRSRGRDDDDGRGWYGDPEGHSEASRRGWAERRGESRSFGRYDDDDDRNSRSQSRDRDDRGRFVSDDDDDRYGGGRGGRSAGSQSRDRDDRGRFTSDDDDRDYGRGGRGNGGGRSYAAQNRDRDERGRFTDDDDDRGRGGRYRSRGRDDDEDRGGRGQGGWFGDSRGHAEAARRGWEERDGGRSTRSRDDDDDRGRGRSSSRGRNDDDDRGHGGWYGDSRGHAEAARRGWDNRR